jgi:hypothetical protein
MPFRPVRARHRPNFQKKGVFFQKKTAECSWDKVIFGRMFAILIGTMMPAAGSVRGPRAHALLPVLSGRRRGMGR